MAYYSVSVLSGATTAGSSHVAFRTGASRAIVRFIEVFNSAATANFVGVGIKGAGTTTPTTSVLGQNLDTNTPASLENVDTAWSAAPGAPTQYYKRVYVAASIGTGLIWSWQKDGPLVVQPNTTITLHNFGAATGGIMSFTFEWEI